MFFLKELPTNTMLNRYAELFPASELRHTKDALIMLRHTSLLIRELEAYFAKKNLSQLKFLIMVVIHRETDVEQISFGDIKDRIDVSKPVLTRTIANMEKEGLLEIKVNENDKRQKFLVLTQHGETKLLELFPDYFKLIDNFMSA